MNLKCLLVILLLEIAGSSSILLPLDTVERLTIQANETVKLLVKEDPDPSDAFWTFEAHSQDKSLVFSKELNSNQLIFKRAEEQDDNVKVNNHPVNKRQSIDYEDYDDRSSSGSGRRRENLDKTINKLLESKEWL